VIARSLLLALAMRLTGGALAAAKTARTQIVDALREA